MNSPAALGGGVVLAGTDRAVLMRPGHSAFLIGAIELAFRTENRPLLPVGIVMVVSSVPTDAASVRPVARGIPERRWLITHGSNSSANWVEHRLYSAITPLGARCPNHQIPVQPAPNTGWRGDHASDAPIQIDGIPGELAGYQAWDGGRSYGLGDAGQATPHHPLPRWDLRRLRPARQPRRAGVVGAGEAHCDLPRLPAGADRLSCRGDKRASAQRWCGRRTSRA
jgi:hypothetical protein